MDIPRFVEALSPSETKEIAAALPLDVLLNTLGERDQQISFEEERLVVEKASPDFLMAELLRRGEQPHGAVGLIRAIEAALQDENRSEADLRRLIRMSQICVDATTDLRHQALEVRGEVFYTASEEPSSFSRRSIGEIAPLSPARVQQVVESVQKSREVK